MNNESENIFTVPAFATATEPCDFKKGNSILNVLEKGRVFTINKIPDGRFDFVEGCDENFGVVLTKEQMIILAAEILKLAGK